MDTMKATMNDLRDPDLEFALGAVRQASWLVKQIQSEMVPPAIAKDDQSPVTVADFSSQALIGALLSQRFPQDTLVAEESAEILRQPEYAGLLEQILAMYPVGSLMPTPNRFANGLTRALPNKQSAVGCWILLMVQRVFCAAGNTR